MPHCTVFPFVPDEPTKALPDSITELTLDLTGLAHPVCWAASVPVELRNDYAEGLLHSWETLTGLTGEAAWSAARLIAGYQGPVTGTVVPF